MNQQPDVEEAAVSPLTKDEIRALRLLLRDTARAKWFWSVVRVFGAWAAGVLAFIVTVGRPLADLVRGWMK